MIDESKMCRSRGFLVGSGVLSLVVFIYATFAHGTLIAVSMINPGQEFLTVFFSSLFGEPQIIALHLITCLLGPILAIIFIRDAYRNPKIREPARSLWVIALIIGYGLIFYWCIYIVGRSDPQCAQTLSDL